MHQLQICNILLKSLLKIARSHLIEIKDQQTKARKFRARSEVWLAQRSEQLALREGIEERSASTDQGAANGNRKEGDATVEPVSPEHLVRHFERVQCRKHVVQHLHP